MDRSPVPSLSKKLSQTFRIQQTWRKAVYVRLDAMVPMLRHPMTTGASDAVPAVRTPQQLHLALVP